MRAAVIEELAGEPIIRDVPIPKPASGECLVEITTAALNPADLVYAAGIRLQPAFPYVPGLEGIGHLEDGSRVYVPMASTPHGTFAEYCIASSVIPVPGAVTDAQALGVGIAGTTGWLCLMWKGALKPGESVLVMGATGAVGQVVVQAAAALGVGPFEPGLFRPVGGILEFPGDVWVGERSAQQHRHVFVGAQQHGVMGHTQTQEMRHG
jgi:NADPH:quinone reductase